MALRPTTISLSIVGGETKALGANDTLARFPHIDPLLLHQVSLASGTGSGNAQKVGLASFSLSGGASVTLDLKAFPGPFGNVDFSSVKEFVVDNQSDRAADVLEVGDDGTVTNPWTSPFAGTNARVKAAPAAPLRIPAPLAGLTVDATHRYLLVKNTNGGTNLCTGNVHLIGEGT